MRNNTIVWIQYTERGVPIPWDGISDDRYLSWQNRCQEAPVAKDATKEELADFFDRNCENANMHDLCGLHHQFAKEWEKEFGEELATIMMRRLASMGGLEVMAFENSRY